MDFKMDQEQHSPLNNWPEENRVIKANTKTAAARYNLKTLRGLCEALRRDPEADIASLLGSTYSQKLESFKSYKGDASTTTVSS